MTTNLHTDGFNQFLTEAAKHEQQIKNPRSTPDMEEVDRFIKDNQDWMSFIAQHPSANRESVENLSRHLHQIGTAEGEEAAKLIDQYLTTDIFLFKDAMMEVLRHTGKDLRDPEIRKTFASASKTAKSMREASYEVRIELINKNRPRLKDLGFNDAEEAIKFLINSPAKDRIKYVNFEELPLNNEQFEKLTKNCPNLQHIEIPKSLLSGDSLKYLANLTNLQSLTIEGCIQLERDALKHIANLTNLRSLNIEGCTQLESDALKHLANLTSLQSLNIGVCTQLESDALKHLANLTNLQSLTIKGCEQLERDALKHLANLTNLQSLDMSWCYQLEGDVLKYIANIKNLQSLSIGECRQLERDALKHLANLTKLQSLDMSWCNQFERDALKHLANLTNLQSLNIMWCRQLEGDALKHLANLINLQSLTILGCGQLKSGVPNLSEIYGDTITGKQLETLLNKFRNEV